jgi:hypothetical protein
MTVRRATAGDFEGVAELILHHDEILREHYHGEPDAQSIRADLRHYFDALEGSTIVFVAEHNGRISGCIVCMTFVKPVTGLPAAAEIYWVVRKDMPSRGAALRRAAENEAAARGVASIIVSAPEPRIADMLVRAGYKFSTMAYERAL